MPFAQCSWSVTHEALSPEYTVQQHPTPTPLACLAVLACWSPLLPALEIEDGSAICVLYFLAETNKFRIASALPLVVEEPFARNTHGSQWGKLCLYFPFLWKAHQVHLAAFTVKGVRTCQASMWSQGYMSQHNILQAQGPFFKRSWIQEAMGSWWVSCLFIHFFNHFKTFFVLQNAILSYFLLFVSFQVDFP